MVGSRRVAPQLKCPFAAKGPISRYGTGCFSTSSKVLCEEAIFVKGPVHSHIYSSNGKTDDSKIESTVHSHTQNKKSHYVRTPLTGGHTSGFPAGMNQRAYEHARQYCRDNELIQRGTRFLHGTHTSSQEGMSFLQQPAHPHRRPHRHPPQQRWIPLSTQRRLCPSPQYGLYSSSHRHLIQRCAIFWMLMTILLTPVKFMVKQVGWL
jgi:hypothetical protein